MYTLFFTLFLYILKNRLFFFGVCEPARVIFVLKYVFLVGVCMCVCVCVVRSACGAPRVDELTPAQAGTTLFVDAVHGSDANPGTSPTSVSILAFRV